MCCRHPNEQSLLSSRSTTRNEYETWGVWASLDWDHFSVAGPTSSDDGTPWTVQGAPTGSFDKLPTETDPLTKSVSYTGHVWAGYMTALPVPRQACISTTGSGCWVY